MIVPTYEVRKLDCLLVRLQRRSVFIPRPVTEEQVGLLYVGTAVKQAGYRVAVLDTPNLPLERLLDRIAEDRVPVVGFYVDHENVHTTLAAVAEIKARYPNIVCVTGGPQSREWDKRLVEGGVDVAVRCEGEIVMPALLARRLDAASDLADLNGITWRDGTEVRRNPDATPIDLDRVPIPDRSLNPDRRRGDGAESIVTGRGCPFRCAFCYEGRPEARYRKRDLDNVLAEVEHLVTARRARYLTVLDDVFLLDPKRAIAFAERVKQLRERLGKPFIWFCEARADIITRRPDMLRACVDAGLTRIQIGVETGSQRSLDAYNKQLQVDETLKGVEIAHKEGVLSIIGNFIIGGAHEDAETLEQSIDFARTLLRAAPGRMEVTSTYFTPYPGTPMYTHPGRYGIIVDDLECVTGPGDNYPFTHTSPLPRNSYTPQAVKGLPA